MTRVLGWQTINAIGDPGQPGTYISYKSLVFCADDKDHRDETLGELTDDQVVFFESQFGTYDSQNHPGGGEYLATITSTGIWPYEGSDPLPKFSQSSDAYPYQDNQNGLSVTWQLTWGAPCGEVEGACSKYDSHDGVYITKTTCESAGGTWTECTNL